ncbi:MAG: SDR family NAD(P)-dependent oxidoreductase [Vicinamibacterales bacterium]
MSETRHPGAALDAGPLADRVRAATELLESLAADWAQLETLTPEDRHRLHVAVAGLYQPDPVAHRQRRKAAAKARRAAAARRGERTLDDTGIRQLRRPEGVTTPNVFPPRHFAPEDVAPHEDGLDTDATRLDAGSPAEAAAGATTDAAPQAGRADAAPSARPGEPDEPQHCYVCKADYTEVHHFYDQLCPACAPLNYRKRTELADLHGRVALVTGARVKIGYQAGLKLLRSGARLIVTTRFPNDAASRYAAEPDHGEWKDRLEIYGLDLRHTPSVETFCRHLLDTLDRLDFIVNNACQTVRRPPAFYRHMIATERAAASGPAGAAALVRHVPQSALTSAELSQVALLPGEEHARADLFPEGLLDLDRQQVDLRDRNSWRLLLDEVSTVELLEVHLVNAVAPFVFNARLKALMVRTPGREKHIVNVSAMEGQFYRRFKTTRHPHTNMAKAALNMMTRTSATDYRGRHPP